MDPSVFSETRFKMAHVSDVAPISPLTLLSLLCLLLLYPYPLYTGMAQVYLLSICTFSVGYLFQSFAYTDIPTTSKFIPTAWVSSLNSRLKYARGYSMPLLGWYNRDLKKFKIELITPSLCLPS